MEMKMSCVCLVLGLVLLMTVSSDATEATGHPVQCCFNFVRFQIPEDNIIKVEKTYSSCPKPGYVVTTKKNKFCMEEIILKKN
ncbi:C-C motif chemokine 14-like [Colossoma macropomum]|uniref:C-C motif chemokine 14-like n=1 Tax=Colossoma macropomum TaxID=42526 RepID=UPI0018646904|nr:C-C motif chemokine 14-like [Colossoma macropomum]XP_036424058.1 C-C motif chemokine 14-like [Colossoma macropomum]